jgi:hypothetical protein
MRKKSFFTMGLAIVSLVAVVLLSGCELDYFERNSPIEEVPKIVSIEMRGIWAESVHISIEVNVSLDEYDLSLKVNEASQVKITSRVREKYLRVHKLDNLEPDTDYSVEIILHNNKGEEVDRGEISFRTDIRYVTEGDAFIIPGARIMFVATDSEEAVYAIGTYGGRPRDKDSFVAKMDNKGKLLWRNNIITPGHSHGASINPILVDEEKNCLYFLNHQNCSGPIKKENFFINSYRLDDGELNWSKDYQGTFSYAKFDLDKNIVICFDDRGIYKINSQGDVIDSYTGEHREGVICFYQENGINKLLLVNVKKSEEKSEDWTDYVKVVAIVYQDFFKVKLSEASIEKHQLGSPFRMTGLIRLESEDRFEAEFVGYYRRFNMDESFKICANLTISGRFDGDSIHSLGMGGLREYTVYTERMPGGPYYIETEDYYFEVHETFFTKPYWNSKKPGIPSVGSNTEMSGRIAPTEWGGYMSIGDGFDIVGKVYHPDWAWLEQFD